MNRIERMKLKGEDRVQRLINRAGGMDVVQQGIDALQEETKNWSENSVICFLLVPHNPDVSGDTPLSLIQQGKTEQAVELSREYLTQRA